VAPHDPDLVATRPVRPEDVLGAAEALLADHGDPVGRARRHAREDREDRELVRRVLRGLPVDVLYLAGDDGPQAGPHQEDDMDARTRRAVLAEIRGLRAELRGMTAGKAASEFFTSYEDAYDHAQEMANTLNLPVAIRKFKEYGIRPGHLVELYSSHEGRNCEIVEPGAPRVRHVRRKRAATDPDTDKMLNEALQSLNYAIRELARNGYNERVEKDMGDAVAAIGKAGFENNKEADEWGCLGKLRSEWNKVRGLGEQIELDAADNFQ